MIHRPRVMTLVSVSDSRRVSAGRTRAARREAAKTPARATARPITKLMTSTGTETGTSMSAGAIP